MPTAPGNSFLLQKNKFSRKSFGFSRLRWRTWQYKCKICLESKNVVTVWLNISLAKPKCRWLWEKYMNQFIQARQSTHSLFFKVEHIVCWRKGGTHLLLWYSQCRSRWQNLKPHNLQHAASRNANYVLLSLLLDMRNVTGKFFFKHLPRQWRKTCRLWRSHWCIPEILCSSNMPEVEWCSTLPRQRDNPRLSTTTCEVKNIVSVSVSKVWLLQPLVKIIMTWPTFRTPMRRKQRDITSDVTRILLKQNLTSLSKSTGIAVQKYLVDESRHQMQNGDESTFPSTRPVESLCCRFYANFDSKSYRAGDTEQRPMDQMWPASLVLLALRTVPKMS